MSTHTPLPPTSLGAGSRAPRRRRWLVALISVVAIIALGAIGIFVWLQQQQHCVKAPDPARSGAVSEYCPSEPYQPTNGGAMVTGPDGNLWYIDSQQRIVRFSPQSGAVTEFAAPTAPNNVAYAGMANGKDGNIWYVANYTLGRISMNGAFKEFALPQDMGFVGNLAVGTDGTLWVTMGSENKGGLLKVTPSSDTSAAPQITKMTLPLAANTQIGPIAAAPDGSLWAPWYAKSGDTILSTHIVRLTPSGAVTQLPLTIPGTMTSLAAGPDGKMWFVITPGHMGRITLAGAVTLFNVSQVGEMTGIPTNLAVEPNGNAWFSTSSQDGTTGVARITPAGVVTTYALPHSGGMINNMTVGPDGGIWLMLGYSQLAQPSSRLVRITP